jgi:hypothetical protein
MFGRDETTAEKMMVGGVAGLVAQTVTYPFEVTRRRMQTSGLVSENLTKELLGGHGSTSSNSKSITSSDATNSGLANSKRKTKLTMRETIQFLYKEQGERGLFKGVSMVRVVARRSITVSCVVSHSKSNLNHRVLPIYSLHNKCHAQFLGGDCRTGSRDQLRSA